MPLKAFKCIVDLTIHMVSAPGVRLANKDDIYLNVCLLGQQRRTRIASAQFPLIFDDHLLFAKTFKFCRDPSDVVNLLNGMHVFIELIQLGKSEDSEILASYETTAKEFLYPIPEFKIVYHTAQRDLFMTPADEFPGAISPQLQFCTSTRLEETRTPELDILREYEERFVYDPLIDFRRQTNRMKRSGAKSAKSNGKSYRIHTIASAIKADYNKPDVRQKLFELNSTVDSRVEETNGKIVNENVTQRRSRHPFVVGRVNEKLIGRSPGSHKVLNDGLVFIRKSRDRNQKRTKSTQANSKTRNRSFSSHRSQSLKTEVQPVRVSRSHSPSLNRENILKKEPEANTELNDTSKLYSSNKKFDTTYENCDLCSNSHQNCEVCSDYRYRTGQSFRGNRFHRDETRLDKTSPIFDKKDPFAYKSSTDLLNETRYLNSSDYLKKSYNSLKDRYSAKDRYPLNNSFSYYSPPLSRYDWRYSRLYPWYYTYTDYIKELEDELYWLKLRSRLIQY